MTGMWLPDRFKERFARRLRRGDAKGAAALARRYAKAFPDDDFGWQSLGQAARRSQDLPAAEFAYKRAAALTPTAWNLYSLGHVLLDQGRIEEGRAVLEPLLGDADRTSRFYGHVGLASAAKKEHCWDEARGHAHEAEDLMPTDTARWSAVIGSIVADIPGEDEWVERLLREATAHGAEPRTYVLLAVVIEDRDPVEAAGHLEYARKHWPGDPDELDRYLPGLRAQRRRLREMQTP